jgi:hypothetical protein
MGLFDFIIEKFINKKINTYQQSQEFIELEAKIKESQEEIDKLGKKLEKHKQHQNKLRIEAEDIGIHIKENFTYEDIINAFPDHDSTFEKIKKKHNI